MMQITKNEIIDKDEVLNMARQAGIEFNEERIPETGFKYQGSMIVLDELEAFAKLVRNDYSNKHAQLWLKRIDDAVKAEREACAKVCEDREEAWRKAGFFKDVHEFREMAFYIRARGTNE